MSTMTTDLDTLSVAALTATSRQVSWEQEFREGYEDGDDSRSYFEYFECEHDNGTTYHLIAQAGRVRGVMIDGRLWEDGDDPDEDDPIDSDTLAELIDVEPSYWGSEGPMMNYIWPVEHARTSATDAAYALRDLPVCVITDDYDDEIVGLALTGGGMDLSWEIAAAYMALGFLPPLALLDLPNMAGSVPGWKADVVAAYRRGLTWMAEDCARRLVRLEDTAGKLGIR